MTATVPRAEDDETSGPGKRVLLVAAAARGLLSIVALFLAPALYRDHVAALVLLRPTKEVCLFSGFVVRRGDAWLPVIVAAALPMLLLGVWIFYGLGRAYADELEDAELPGVAGRLLPKHRIDRLREVLEDRGTRVVFLGRLAAFPSTLMAAAAGASGVPVKEFVVADAAGAIVSMTALLGLGYALGEAYEEAGPWVTAAGVVVLVALLFMLGRALMRPTRSRS
jgi:membrane protein DedA with SNARE-associated domain